MSLRGIQTVVRRTLVAIIADNLASHQIGGLKIGFARGFRKCRFCMATDADIQYEFYDFKFLPCSKEQHNLHCASLETAVLRVHLRRVYGITKKLKATAFLTNYSFSMS